MDFIFDNFIIIWLCCLVFALVSFTLKHSSNKRKKLYFQDPENSSIIYSESTASGKSDLSFLTKSGSASNCLKIMLTDDTLYIRPIFPFLIIGPQFDLIHAIPVSQIQKAVKNEGFLNKWIDIEFTDKNNKLKQFSIGSKNPNELLSTLSDKYIHLKSHE